MAPVVFDLARDLVEAVARDGADVVAASRWRLSPWSAAEGFVHGADMVPALWRLAASAAERGEELVCLETARFRRMITEQLALRASAAPPPSSAALALAFATSRGRALHVWGHHDGRPLDRDVLLPKNPLVFPRIGEPLAARCAIDDEGAVTCAVDAADAGAAALHLADPGIRTAAMMDLAGFVSRAHKACGVFRPEALFLLAELGRCQLPAVDELAAPGAITWRLRRDRVRLTAGRTWLLPADMTWSAAGRPATGSLTLVLAYDDEAATFTARAT